LGTIGTYHYDDETCHRANATAAALVRHLADECQTQGPAFLELYLEALLVSVVDELAARGDLSRARDVARSRTPAGGPRH